MIDEDTDPGGPRKLYEVALRGRVQKQRYLLCRCPSTKRDFLLAVDPSCETCHTAAAWMAGFNNPDDYLPVQET